MTAFATASAAAIASDAPAMTPEAACEALEGFQDQLRALSDERDDVATAAGVPASILFHAMGKQKSKRIGAFTAYLTYDERRYCKCCRVRVGQCPNPVIEVITEVAPRISVKRKDQDDAASS